MYVLVGIFAGMLAVIMSVIIRLELAFPNDSLLCGGFQYFTIGLFSLIIGLKLYSNLKFFFYKYMKLFYFK